MMPRRRRWLWIERQFPLGLPLESYPDTVERLRGAPARLEERLRNVKRQVLVRKNGSGWSIQEHAGHLGDLEPLWAGRMSELEAGAQALRAADLTNRATREARHNDQRTLDVLSRYRALREVFVGRLEVAPDDLLLRTALHPRLQRPMSLVDLAYFVAEHDDHHLATITQLLT